jgi:hypothetical protein
MYSYKLGGAAGLDSDRGPITLFNHVWPNGATRGLVCLWLICPVQSQERCLRPLLKPLQELRAFVVNKLMNGGMGKHGSKTVPA